MNLTENQTIIVAAAVCFIAYLVYKFLRDLLGLGNDGDNNDDDEDEDDEEFEDCLTAQEVSDLIDTKVKAALEVERRNYPAHGRSLEI